MRWAVCELSIRRWLITWGGLEQTSEGAAAALEIESADEVKTLLRFRSPMPAEMVDGVVAEQSD